MVSKAKRLKNLVGICATKGCKKGALVEIEVVVKGKGGIDLKRDKIELCESCAESTISEFLKGDSQ